jgi:hypothetical protein
MDEILLKCCRRNILLYYPNRLKIFDPINYRAVPRKPVDQGRMLAQELFNQESTILALFSYNLTLWMGGGSMVDQDYYYGKMEPG